MIATQVSGSFTHVKNNSWISLFLTGCTPLHIAAHHGNINIANYLLSLGAKVNAKTKVTFLIFLHVLFEVVDHPFFLGRWRDVKRNIRILTSNPIKVKLVESGSRFSHNQPIQATSLCSFLIWSLQHFCFSYDLCPSHGEFTHFYWLPCAFSLYPWRRRNRVAITNR